MKLQSALHPILIGCSSLLAVTSLHAAPTPDPMTFDVVPAAVAGPAGESKITMTASLATGVGAVEYYFTETSGNLGGDDSGWQDSQTYTDDGLTPGTNYSYNVKARDLDDMSESAVSTPDDSASTSADDGTQPVIYEPFAYPTGDFNGASGLSEIGLDGTWTAKTGSALLNSGSLSHGSLPTAGNSAGTTGASNHFGGARAVSASALAGNGLLDDGAVLWFSVIMGYDAGGNRTNSRLLFVLADESFNGGNFNYWLDGSGTTGLGVTLGNLGGSGRFAATQVRDSSFGDGLAGLVFGTTSSGILPSTNTSVDTALIVGKITWGATPADPDLIELFAPATDLAFPDTSSPISTLSVTVDQSGYDTITWARGDLVVMDEIRFGASYNDVIQADLVTTPDGLPPTPDPASFAVVPTVIDSANVTMTATVANDPSEVEYFFDETSGNPGGTDSGWQDSPTYVDSGLEPETTYTYTVQTRDKSVGNNTGTASAGEDVTTPELDIIPPTPNPMTFAVNPTAISNTEITMTATTATDNTYDVEYQFHNTTLNTFSGWQSSETWTDTGLTPSTSYTYTVTARDLALIPNEGTASDPESTSTVATDDTAPTPDPATWATAPTAVSDTEVTMTATTATDDQYGVEYYFANRSIIDGSHDSGWQASPTYNDTGLTPFTSYTYQVTVRDTSYNNNETVPATAAVVTDLDPAIVTPTLTEGPHYIVGSQNSGGADFDLSLFPGAARYAGTTGANGPVLSSFGDGTALDYNLFKPDGGAIVSYADGGAGLVGLASGSSGSNYDYADVWTVSDPGNDFTANPADFTSPTGAGGINGSVTGSVNISGMTEGILYFIYGAYRNEPNIDLVMSIPGQPEDDVTLDNAGDTDFANNAESYVVAVSFQNAGDYDTISYTYNTTNGAIYGVVLDGESTPVAGSPYDDWAADAGDSFLGTLTDPTADLDFDGGGLDTGIEWVVGGDPTDGSDDAGKAPIFDNTDPDFFIFTFIRTDEANNDGNTTIEVEYGSDLSGWTTAVDDATNVFITETDNGATDSVEVKLRRSFFGSPLFARLNVVVTP